MKKKTSIIDAMYEQIVEPSLDFGTTIKVIHGRPGRDGRDGKDGPPGPAGRDGMSIPGLPGKDGRDGIDGLDGTNGKDGLPGIGRAGPPGKDGQDGKDGRDGKDGKSFAWKGDWDKNLQYKEGDVVFYEDTSYVCIKDNRHQVPKAEFAWRSIVKPPKAVQYVTKNAGAPLAGSGGGGNASATLMDIFNQIDNLSMITPHTFNEYLWKISSHQAAGGTLTISYRNGLYQKIVVSEDTNLNLIEFPDVDYLGRLTLEIINTSNKAIVWGNSVLWNGGIAPDPSMSNYIVVLTTTDSGETIFGNIVGKNYSI